MSSALAGVVCSTLLRPHPDAEGVGGIESWNLISPPGQEMRYKGILSTLAEHGVDYVLVAGTAATLYGAGPRPGAMTLCFRQRWRNCECLINALDQLRAELVPPVMVPIPLTAELRKTCQPLSLRTAAGDVCLTPVVPALGTYDDIRSEALTVILRGLTVTLLTLDQLLLSLPFSPDPGDRNRLPHLAALRHQMEAL